MKGYFKPPVSGKFRFYVACDDWCRVNLGTSKDPSTKTLIYDSAGYTSYRSYIHPANLRSSDWIDLVKDEYYFIEAL